MSRTYKDRPTKVRFPEVYPYWVEVEKTKKRKELDTEWHWMSTPSSWTRLMMTRPERRMTHLLETKALKVKVIDIEEVDFPDLGRKPHQYFW